MSQVNHLREELHLHTVEMFVNPDSGGDSFLSLGDSDTSIIKGGLHAPISMEKWRKVPFRGLVQKGRHESYRHASRHSPETEFEHLQYLEQIGVSCFPILSTVLVPGLMLEKVVNIDLSSVMCFGQPESALYCIVLYC